MKLFGNISIEFLKELVHAAGIHAVAIAIEKSLRVDIVPALISAAVLRIVGIKVLVWLLAALRRTVIAIAGPATRALFVPALWKRPGVGATQGGQNKLRSANSMPSPVRNLIVRRRAFLKTARKQRQSGNRR